MPVNLNPPVFWILIGTNDFGNTWCTPEMVLVGILQVVQYIQSHKPHATIVVNGLLPRTYDRDGFLMHTNQYPLRKHKGGPPLLNEIQSVNEQLKKYCDAHSNLLYFDATDVFLVKDDGNDHDNNSNNDNNDVTTGSDTAAERNQETKQNSKLRIDITKMDDFLHPTDIGQRLWGEKIVEVLDVILHG